jgi:hypothetical protein
MPVGPNQIGRGLAIQSLILVLAIQSLILVLVYHRIGIWVLAKSLRFAVFWIFGISFLYQ